MIILTYDKKQNRLEQFYTSNSFQIEQAKAMIDDEDSRLNGLIKYRAVNACEINQDNSMYPQAQDSELPLPSKRQKRSQDNQIHLEELSTANNTPEHV